MPHLQRQSTEHLQPAFTPAARKHIRRTVKSPPPFSLRLSGEERAKLENAAAGMSLGSYIQARLFDGAREQIEL